MSKFYFFTKPDKIDPQSQQMAFGVRTSSATHDEYCVTNMFSSSSSPFAFAVTGGVVLVQEIAGSSDRVNLILKPFKAPDEIFVPIHFYVYKGVKKSSIISGDDVAPRGTSDLVDGIRDSHERRREAIIEENKNGGSLKVPPKTPPASILGIEFKGEGFEDSVNVEKVFLSFSGSQLPVVQGGGAIGEFSSPVLLHKVGRLHALKTRARGCLLTELNSVIDIYRDEIGDLIINQDVK